MLKRFTRLVGLSLVLLTTVAILTYLATLYRAGAPQEGYLALTGAAVLAGETLEVEEDAVILIRDGVIVGVGARDAITIPPQARIIDLQGTMILPGLIDLHVHMGSPELAADERPGPGHILALIFDAVRFEPDKRRNLLAHGITTVRDLGSEYGWIVEMRQKLSKGELEGPRLLVAGPLFTTPEGHPIVTIGVDAQSDGVRVPETADEARQMVRQLAAGAGRVDVIKVVQERGGPRRALQPIDRDVLSAIVDEAHAQDLPVVAHWGTAQDLQDALDAGVDELQHLEPRGVPDGWPEATLQRLVQSQTPLAPTLAVSSMALPADVSQTLRFQARQFYEAGGRVLAGSDAGMPGVFFGPGLHRELELLVQSGLTPRQALMAASVEAAKALRRDDLGAIAPGRAADLVVVRGNALQDISAARNIVVVLRDGRVVVDYRNEMRGR